MVVIIFDLETSGLNPYHDDIIEIGAKVYNSDNSFQALLKPKSNKAISRKITDITGISNKMLKEEGRPWLTVYSEFYNWLYEATNSENLAEGEKVTIVSHNGLTFDFIFLKRLLKDLSLKTGSTCRWFYEVFSQFLLVDTLLLSRRLLPDRSYYSQPAIAKTYQILIDNAHRAMGDVIVLEQIYTKLLLELEKVKINGLNEPDKIIDYIDLKI